MSGNAGLKLPLGREQRLMKFAHGCLYDLLEGLVLFTDNLHEKDVNQWKKFNC